MKLLGIVALCFVLAGCVPNVIEASTNVWCQTNAPTRPTHAQYALYSHQQKVDMADHNAFGAKFCHWKP